MKAVALIVTLALGLLAAPLPAEAQKKAGKVYRVGYLCPVRPAPCGASLKAFLEGLRDFGWVKGRDFVIEAREAEGKIERLPALAAELVHLKVDVILATGPPGVRAAISLRSRLLHPAPPRHSQEPSSTS